MLRQTRVALLTNFIPPYRLPLFRVLQQRCTAFQIFLSAATEAGRTWPAEWGEVPVNVQRNIALRPSWRHPHGFSEPLTVHIPYDTLPQLMRFRPDVIVSAEIGARTFQATAYSRSSGRPLVIWATLSEATEQGRGRCREWLRRTLLARAHAVIVNGESGARYVRRFGVPEKRVFKVPQTTNLQGFLDQPLGGVPTAGYRLLYSGQLVERKGLVPFLAHLANWAADHRSQDVELGLVGDGPLRSKLASFQVPANLRLHFYGDVSYDRLPEIYGVADILALPTLADEWGLVVVEGMAAGLPVLGSVYSQAVEELVEDGRTGWVFRPDDPASVQSALSRALSSNPAQLLEIGSSARHRVRSMTPASMADQIMSAIDYALANSS